MKPFVSTLALLMIALGVGGYLWWDRRNPALPPGSVALLSLDAKSIRTVQIEIGASSLLLQRAPHNDEWQVRSGGKSAPADPDRVSALLQSLQLVPSSAVGDLSRERDYGLVPPRATITIATSSGRTPLDFGIISPVTAQKIYARANGKVGIVPIAPLQNAVGDFESWRDHAILRFDPQTVTQFTIAASHLKATFQKQGHGNATFWQISAPLRARADAVKVDTFLRALASTRFAGGASTPLAADQTATPVGEVVVQGSEGKGVLKFFDTREKDAALRWAGQNAANNTFMLPPSIPLLINRPLFAWRDTTILAFRIVDITRINVKFAGKTQRWEREGATWHNTSSGAKKDVAEMTRAALLDLLLAAQNLRATRFFPLSNNQKTPLSTFVLEIQVNDQSLSIARNAGQLRATSSALPDAAQLAPDGFAALEAVLHRLWPTAPRPATDNTLSRAKSR